MKPLSWLAASAALLAGNPCFAQQSDRVQDGTFQVPAWIISKPSTVPGPNAALPVGPDPTSQQSPFFSGTVFGAPIGYGSSPFGYGFGGTTLGGGYGGYGVPGFGGYGGGWGAPRFGGIGYGGGWGAPGFGGIGFGGYGVPGFGGYGGWGAPGFGGIGYGGIGYGGFGGFGGYGGWGGWGAPGFGGIGYGGWGGGWGGYSPAGSAMFMGAFGASMMNNGNDGLPQTPVVQTGPSPSSGNYYEPASVNPSASGSYYAQTGTTAFPVSTPSSQPKDYWGSMGSPFPKDLNSTPWSK